MYMSRTVKIVIYNMYYILGEGEGERERGRGRERSGFQLFWPVDSPKSKTKTDRESMISSLGFDEGM